MTNIILSVALYFTLMAATFYHQQYTKEHRLALAYSHFIVGCSYGADIYIDSLWIKCRPEQVGIGDDAGKKLLTYPTPSGIITVNLEIPQ